MAMRVVDVIERNLFSIPIPVMALTQNQNTVVVKDSTQDPLPDELVLLQIFNTQPAGGASIYINLAAPADNLQNYDVILAPQQQYSVPCRQSVNCYTTGAGVGVAITKIVRKDFQNAPNLAA